MHPRNLYLNPPDFRKLSETFPPLKPFLQPNSNTVDFHNEDAQRCVTRALLHRDFNLKIQLPTNRLCPPVPNRLNYVLWIQDIVKACQVVEGEEQVTGIDIGTGASAIYPLLACRLESRWKFVVTELDDVSETHARENVESNALDDQIQILKATKSGPLLLPLSDDTQTFDFTMCNPPFYSSAEDVAQSSEAKVSAPNAVCTGAAIEMITEGGESAFVRQMVEESTRFGTRCKWYTSMLGKLSSAAEVVKTLEANSIENYAITEFVQGQTRRWAVGWSFTDIRLPDSVSRIQNPNPLIQRYIPPHNTIRQPAKITDEAFEGIMSGIPGVTVENRPSYFLVKAAGDTWSRAARRKRRNQMDVSEETVRPEPAMICTVVVADDFVEFQWVRGVSRSLFESFCSHVSRKFTSPH
ncbi:hypothetical protein V5O48_003425 [Marasmius crinis-equi]|uniref:U6 small nuclear RNA (adenine-(43)-N(6))-methyltransferase n=1 Tax=Marasmius crinis-equi TaxID=585013 RepID=A0ABR3FTC5_9AGAR